ncbi:hypothetical protein COT94_00325 [Candidatus Falkowbacteria bacterium CG10_big_fil_rev_8_21_14_0_10_37_14]|uniref:ComEC/Rec2-related protein domain-containing protein n=1 Tax=Candidatus Falkowbacteria bacterium CG10_big_fil_rev_8_21_14_0_10_37_14 TaxID=1974561 RepID=A0A2M6WUD9_9BACT|nr:ComEC family competence protein [Candidatus Falkowbacteria bacterium]PIT96394.1 MAG: hypothetical protein COT94_00325 [Candidatus Falkowbacteria bacterium CG10_big_fil_rev_8_21_14_0_10_37_14]
MKLHPAQYLSGWSIAVVLGITWGLFFKVGWLWSPALLSCVGLVLAVIVKIFFKRFRYSGLIVGIIIFFILAWVRCLFVIPQVSPDSLIYYNERPTELTACVIGEPRRNSKDQRLILGSVKIENKKVSRKLLTVLPLYPIYNYGDCLFLSGKLQTPQPIQNFAYDKYLLKDDIVSVMYRPRVLILSKGEGFWWHRSLINLRQWLASDLADGLVEPAASLAQAMTLGYQEWLYQTDMDSFAKTGTIHIISISGLHIGVLVIVILQLLLLLGLNRRLVVWVALPFLIIYVVTVGSPAAAARSALMAIIALLAVNGGRLSDLGRAWLLAGVILLLINPWLLVADIGFQLSFLSVWGLIYLTPPIIKILSFWPKLINNAVLQKIWQWVVIVLSAGLAATLATMPLVIIYFERWSIIGVLANLIIVPLSSLALLSVFGAWILNIFLPIKLACLPAQIILDVLFRLNNFLASVSWSSMTVEAWPMAIVVLYYLLLCFGIWFFNKNSSSSVY